MFPETAPNTSAPTPASGGAPPPGAASTPDPNAPKKRGRPFGARNRAAPLTETPVDGAAPPDAEPIKRRRRTKALDKEQLSKQLIGIHAIAAKLTGLPFVQIDKMESDMLADAIDNIAREYDLALDGKTGAFLQLMAASAVVYGPRVMMYQALKRKAMREAAVTVDGVATEAGQNGASAATA